MKSLILRCAVLLTALTSVASATLVTPPTIDWVSIPATATVGQSVTVGVGGHANPSDNSDGNNWNGTKEVVDRIIILVTAPGASSSTSIHDWLSPYQTPASASASFTVTTPGTYTVQIQLMDNRPWYSNVLTYSVYAPTPNPVITSSLSMATNQDAYTAYQITAANSPTRFSAANLPPGMTLNASTGAITGWIGTGGNYTSTITAFNAYGSDTETLTWNVTAAVILPTASVSPNSIYVSQSVTMTRAGTTNFPGTYTQGTIWYPNGGYLVLPQQGLGSSTYTPDQGPGTYTWQFRLADEYGNFKDQDVAFTVVTPSVSAPTSLQASTIGSIFVVLNWSGASAQAGISRYDIYRNGSFIGSSTTTSYTDSTVASSTGYTYTVYTIDTQDNPSPLFASVNVTTAIALQIFGPLL